MPSATAFTQIKEPRSTYPSMQNYFLTRACIIRTCYLRVYVKTKSCNARRSIRHRFTLFPRVSFTANWVKRRNKQCRWKIMNRIAYINTRRLLRHIVRFICMRQPRSRRAAGHTRDKRNAQTKHATRLRRVPCWCNTRCNPRCIVVLGEAFPTSCASDAFSYGTDKHIFLLSRLVPVAFGLSRWSSFVPLRPVSYIIHGFDTGRSV